MTRPSHEHEIGIGLRMAIIGAVLLVVAVGVGIAVVTTDSDLIDLDAWWNAYVTTFLPGIAPVSFFMNVAGAGVIGTYVVPLVGAALLALFRRPWGAVLFLAASAFGALVVQLLKSVFGRVRPEEILVISDHGSFPSGHTANAAVLATVAVILFPRVWVLIVGLAWTLLMAFSRTQVHAHWLSDTLGAMILGVATTLLVAAALAIPVVREREKRLSLG
ncbi:phosphatase PAP2 family protein [Microbacterium sp. 179-B 1A2 NHS]|uniref:phosphatase PAP2 family protein n=1 Tax=Microbacterium sp. 179-B 1A2 NHS TaxID=3142383 RepID=UPI0039A18C6B